MNTLKAQRGDLVNALTARRFTVVDHLPERLPAPCALLAAGSPYVESGDSFGSYTVRFTVQLVCSVGTNQAETVELDEHITAFLVALDASAWELEQVNQPEMLSHGNAFHLSTTVDVARTVTGIDDGRS